MRFRITGKQAVQVTGCAFFCLIVCGMAFLNRMLLLEPMTDLLHRSSNFEEMKEAVHQNYLSDRLRGKDELLTLNGGYARLQGRTRYNDVQRMTTGMPPSSSMVLSVPMRLELPAASTTAAQ